VVLAAAVFHNSMLQKAYTEKVAVGRQSLFPYPHLLLHREDLRGTMHEEE
jgi:hypothetical protein